MASTVNPFDLLVDNDTDDLTELVKVSVVAEKKSFSGKSVPAVAAAAQVVKPTAKLPSKPLPPSQAVREARSDAGRGGGRGRGRGRDYGERDSSFNGNSGGYKPSDERDSGKSVEKRVGYGGPRGSFRGGRGGGFSNGEATEGERPRRVFERRSGTGRGSDFKRDGAGRGNWGTPTDEPAPEPEETQPEKENNVDEQKQLGEQETEIVSKEKRDDEPEEKEQEEKEMTLEEYEKVLEEKRKALLLNKPEERKVNVDKELQSMKQIANKKANDEVFAKLGAEKEKRKESADKEEKTKKAVSITEFLKPAEGERSSYGGRGRGRGRGPRGGFNGSSQTSRPTALANIEDPGHFPALGSK
ncbi:unnamed protein product [Rhodiola kirilowii]